MFAENVQGKPSCYPGHGRELASGYDSALQYLDRMHQESVQIFRQLTAEDFRRTCTAPGGAEMRTWKWLRSMVEQEVHHRGQIYLMRRMIDILTPPLNGLTSEQVRERSVPFAPPST